MLKNLVLVVIAFFSAMVFLFVYHWSFANFVANTSLKSSIKSDLLELERLEGYPKVHPYFSAFYDYRSKDGKKVPVKIPWYLSPIVDDSLLKKYSQLNQDPLKLEEEEKLFLRQQVIRDRVQTFHSRSLKAMETLPIPTNQGLRNEVEFRTIRNNFGLSLDLSELLWEEGKTKLSLNLINSLFDARRNACEFRGFENKPLDPVLLELVLISQDKKILRFLNSKSQEQLKANKSEFKTLLSHIQWLRQRDSIEWILKQRLNTSPKAYFVATSSLAESPVVNMALLPYPYQFNWKVREKIAFRVIDILKPFNQKALSIYANGGAETEQKLNALVSNTLKELQTIDEQAVNVGFWLRFPLYLIHPTSYVDGYIVKHFSPIFASMLLPNLAQMYRGVIEARNLEESLFNKVMEN